MLMRIDKKRGTFHVFQDATHILGFGSALWYGTTTIHRTTIYRTDKIC